MQAAIKNLEEIIGNEDQVINLYEEARMDYPSLNACPERRVRCGMLDIR